MKYDLAWGNSIAVRDAFLSVYNQSLMLFGPRNLATMDYPAHEGDFELIEMTRQVIKRQTGKSYRHVFLTNGATGGVVIGLRAFFQEGYELCLTRPAPYYVRYPSMIQASGLMQTTKSDTVNKSLWFPEESKEVEHTFSTTMVLLDLPSNPLALTTTIPTTIEPVLIDGVYLNKVYFRHDMSLPKHRIMVGSYSKLLGINGIRVGWIATDDDLLAPSLAELVTSEYCGLSTPSQEILKMVLKDLDWAMFESGARYRMDANREEWSKLEKFFGDTPTPENGMFYYAPMDQKAQELFDKAGIKWTLGSALGTNDGFARFNIGQGNELVKLAVREVLKADKI